MRESGKKNPKVSIITVCLNSEKYLEEAIKSVCEQTYPDIEYLVIDGGSTDRSVEIFDKYENRIDKLVIEKDGGIYEAMNKGIRLVSGEIIYFLNSDDRLFDKMVVEMVVAAFMDNSDADFIYGNIAVMDPVRRTSYIETSPRKITKRHFINRSIGHPASFFRSRCFQKAGYFDQNYKIAADYEWYLRAVFAKGLKAVYINDNMSVFRLGGMSTGKEHAQLYLRERRSIQKKYFNSLEMLCADLLSIAKRLLGKKANEFIHNLKTGRL
ncbi:glycosyltransferase family 2 protein [Candidatus Omnitrophota bacterium]